MTINNDDTLNDVIIKDCVKELCLMLDNISPPNIYIMEPYMTMNCGDDEYQQHITGVYNSNNDTLFVYQWNGIKPISVIRNLAHELRHKWQFIHDPELYTCEAPTYKTCKRIDKCWFRKIEEKKFNISNYSRTEYLKRPNEIDAEAFALRYISGKFNEPWEDVYPVELDELKSALKNRIHELDEIYG